MKQEFVSFQKAKQIIQKQGFKSFTQYKKWDGKKKNNLPYDLDKTYKDDWKGWDDFINTPSTEKEADHQQTTVTSKKQTATITQGVISLKEAAKICPAILTDEKLNKLSDRYKQVNTYKVLENIMKAMPGWEISFIKETHIRKEELRPFTHHVVKLQNSRYRTQTGDSIQLVISNSHNGVSKFEFYFGFFRQVCSNGMIVFDKRFGAINKKHFTDYEVINEYIIACVENTKKLMDLHKTFSEKILTKKEKIDLAIKGLHARYQYKNSYIELMYEELKQRYDIESMIKPLREEDEGDSLWIVFNIIQERITKGEYYAKVDSGLSKANPIKSTHLDVQFNKKFWEYAMTYIDVPTDEVEIK